MESKIAKLHAAAVRLNKARVMYLWVRQANHCLPKHKEKKFDELTTQALIKLKNAESAYQAAERKYGRYAQLR